MKKTLLSIIAMAFIVSCYKPKNHPDTFAKSIVSIDGQDIPFKQGYFFKNSRNKWTQVNKTESEHKTQNRNPTILVKQKNKAFDFWLVKLRTEDSYRYLYLSDQMSMTYSPRERRYKVDVSIKKASDGIFELTPKEKLEPGEYAIWMNCGDTYPKREKNESSHDFESRMSEHIGGSFWTFAIEPPESPSE